MLDATATAHVHSHGRRQQLAGRRFLQQPLGRLFDRREMRNLVQLQRRDERWMIRQVRNDATVVGLQKVLQRQAGKELMLRELLGAARV
jgi:hypothetical protein